VDNLEFARSAPAEAEREHAARKHSKHLANEPVNVCIPGFNGMPYAAVDFVGTPFDPGRVWAEVRLCHDGTRGVVLCESLAHSRECSEASCTAVWNNARQRQHRYTGRTFLLVANPKGWPFITAIDEHLAVLQMIKKMTGQNPSESKWFHAYDISTQTAEALHAGRVPEAAPVDRRPMP
jgi:hypothetical protein